MKFVRAGKALKKQRSHYEQSHGRFAALAAVWNGEHGLRQGDHVDFQRVYRRRGHKSKALVAVGQGNGEASLPSCLRRHPNEWTVGGLLKLGFTSIGRHHVCAAVEGFFDCKLWKVFVIGRCLLFRFCNRLSRERANHPSDIG